MTEEEWIENCNQQARNNVRAEEIETTFLSPNASNSPTETNLRLFKSDKLQEYLKVYCQIYRLIMEQDPLRIVIRKGFFVCKDLSELDLYRDRLEFEHCKFEISASKPISGLACKSFTQCDIQIVRHAKSIAVDVCKNSVFRNGDSVTLLHSRGESTECRIEDSTLENLTCSSKYQISGCFIKELRFDNNSAVRIVLCNIDNINFSSSDIEIKDTTFTVANFSNLKNCKRIILQGVTFRKPPTLPADFGTHNLQFRGLKFEDTQSDSALGAFRQLKALCEKAGYEHGAILFHGFELETYFNAHLKKCRMFHYSDWPEKWLSIAHKIFSDYGRDLMRPFLWICLILLSFALINWLMWMDGGMYAPLKCSLRNSLGPMIFALPNNGNKFCDGVAENLAGHILHFFQIVITSIIWFLVVFMARRRFKL